MVIVFMHAQPAFAAHEPAEHSSTGSAQGRQKKPASRSAASETIIVTAARSSLPATSLPLNYEVIGGTDLRRAVALYGSMVDAVSARIPAFSPTREKLSGSGETLRGRSRLHAIHGAARSTPIPDARRQGRDR